jgi:hypothetical protein
MCEFGNGGECCCVMLIARDWEFQTTMNRIRVSTDCSALHNTFDHMTNASFTFLRLGAVIGYWMIFATDEHTTIRKLFLCGCAVVELMCDA